MFHISLKKFDTPIGQKGYGSEESYQKSLKEGLAEGFEDVLVQLEIFSVDRMALLGFWSFDVTWCGKSWKTNIDDFDLIAASIPRAAYRLYRGRPSDLFFFEQGFEHYVDFRPIGSNRILTELYWIFELDPAAPKITEGRYFPRMVEQDKDALIENLRQAFRVYYEAVRDYCPEVWSANLVKRYFDSRPVKFCIEG